jgi:hypothetical protein
MRLNVVAVVVVGLSPLGLQAAMVPPPDGASSGAGTSGYEVGLPPEALNVTDLAVLPTGELVVAGLTASREFPVTADAFDRSCGSTATSGDCTDGFVMVLDTAGNVRFSTFIGGDGPESHVAVAPAGNGVIWALVSTASTALDERGRTECNGHQPVLVRLSPGGAASYGDVVCVGGPEATMTASDIGLAPDGSVWIAGTDCTGRADTTNAWQPVLAGGCDIFVARYRAGQSQPMVATYIGGGQLDYPTALAVAPDGDLVVTGVTLSRDFPSVRPFQGHHGGEHGPDDFNHDAILARLDASGRWMEYSTCVGGMAQDHGLAVTTDGAGNVYVAGSTWSEDFPLTEGAINGSNSPRTEEAFLLGVDRVGALLFSTLLGGGGSDHAGGVSVQPDGALLVVGGTSSPDFPVFGEPGGQRPAGDARELPFFARTDLLATRLWRSVLIPVRTGMDAWREGWSPENRLEGIATDGRYVYVAGRTRVWTREGHDWASVETGHYVKKWRVG